MISLRPAKARPRNAHLDAALAAILLLGAMLTVGALFARWMESRYIHALAPQLLGMKNQGSALQAEALRHPDLLVVYGSSELSTFLGPFHANELFRSRPTGFMVFPVGTPGTNSLIILQDLAGVADAVRGKKLAIFAGPLFFRAEEYLREAYYRGNFSLLHASELAFDSRLSFGLKQDIARRMLEYASTLDDAPLERFALQRLADGSPLDRAAYEAVLPLGKLHTLIVQLQDHSETLATINAQQGLEPIAPRQGSGLDWAALEPQALEVARQQSASNPFGFHDLYWQYNSQELLKARRQNRDGTYVRYVREGLDLTDYELMLRTSKELGAKAMVLSCPIKGPYYDYWGVSAEAREAYYRKVRTATRPYDVPLLDFQEFDGDPVFDADVRSTPSQWGWLHYSRALDAFFHGSSP